MDIEIDKVIEEYYTTTSKRVFDLIKSLQKISKIIFDFTGILCHDSDSLYKICNKHKIDNVLKFLVDENIELHSEL